MGAFCVFGISKSVCRAQAEKKTPVAEGSGKDRRYLTMQEWAVKRDEMTEQLFTADGTRSVKISPEFDAPQFCNDWIAVNPSHIRNARIMVRGPKVDESGAPVKRNGAPVMTWLEYEGQRQLEAA